MDVPDDPDPQFKVPVVRRGDYTIHLEQASKWHCFVHCDVRRWSPETKLALQADWETLKGLHGGPFHALHDPRDAKHLKFLRMFGFKHLESFKDKSGRPQEIHIT